MRINARGALRLVIAALVIAYVVWSQFALHRSKVAFANERRRALNIADHLELWRELAASGGHATREALEKSSRKIELTLRNPTEGLPLPPGDRVYTMIYDEPAQTRQRKLDRYLSDLVLHNYFYVVVGSRGEIKEMFWDKP
jgi:hypothetical protein